MNFLKSRERFARGIALVGNCVADLHVGDRFDIRDEIADVASLQSRLDEHFGRKYAHFLDFVAPVVAHHPDRLIRFHFSRYHADVSDNAAIDVEYGIEHERAQRRVLWLFRRRNPMHDRFQYLVNPGPHFRARVDRFLGWDRENLL